MVQDIITRCAANRENMQNTTYAKERRCMNQSAQRKWFKPAMAFWVEQLSMFKHSSCVLNAPIFPLCKSETGVDGFQFYPQPLLHLLLYPSGKSNMRNRLVFLSCCSQRQIQQGLYPEGWHHLVLKMVPKCSAKVFSKQAPMWSHFFSNCMFSNHLHIIN